MPENQRLKAMNGAGGVLSGNHSDKNFGAMMGQTMGSMTSNAAAGASEGVISIYNIVQGVSEDLKNLKNQMENIPPMPRGQNVPAPLAKFQNNINKIEKELINNLGENNRRVFPKIDNKV